MGGAQFWVRPYKFWWAAEVRSPASHSRYYRVEGCEKLKHTQSRKDKESRMNDTTWGERQGTGFQEFCSSVNKSCKKPDRRRSAQQLKLSQRQAWTLSYGMWCLSGPVRVCRRFGETHWLHVQAKQQEATGNFAGIEDRTFQDMLQLSPMLRRSSTQCYHIKSV
jgi:hypothetical protein